MANEINPTQGSLLGFLFDGPKTGWDLIQEVQKGLARFWNLTPSHVYRELRNLEERGLIVGGLPEVRDRRPFTITPDGRSAFTAWIVQDPPAEQIRFPLLVSLWFGRHLDPSTMAGFMASSRKDHERRLRSYQVVEAPDEHTGAVLSFGIAYEKAVIAWLDGLLHPNDSPSNNHDAQ
ncbi:MAG: PadR family transcriptional regulator [Acidimicrobiales bacterium]